MAAYYIDGTIVSASGTGSGTIGDPWGKTDDLLQYTLDQIVAGAGRGSSGDTVYITGDLNQTASIDFTFEFTRPSIISMSCIIKSSTTPTSFMRLFFCINQVFDTQ